MLKLCLFLLLLCSACQLSKTNDTSLSNEQVYHVKNIDTLPPILIDGQMDALWERAIRLTDFKDQWYHKNVGQTNFRALWDKEWLYFSYTVNDNEIILEQDFSDSESNAVRSDRVEIFLSSLTKDSIYYAFEMDADARLFDSKGVYTKYIDDKWDMPSTDIQLASLGFKGGYTLEGKMSLQRLRELDVLTEKSELKAGLFRGDYSSGQDSIVWISWGKADSPKPNFHLPSALGVLKLDKQ